MMTRILFCLSFFPMIGFTQTTQHNFFGIDLNKDWYTLTNYSKIGYSRTNADSLNKDPFIFTDINFFIKTVELHPVFDGVDEFVAGFERIKNPDLNILKPELFLARINYSSEEYELKGKKDALRILSIVKNEFGDAELNMVRDEYSTYTWRRVNYDIVLTTRKDALMTMLMYMKK
jgi:hypothetical protein